MNTPNKLTVLRVILSPIFLAVLMVDFPFHYLIAGLIFGFAALTDLLDGRIARSQGLITNFGKFLDPLADKMLTTAALLGFLASGHIDVWAVMLVLAREFMVTSIRLIAAKDGVVVAASLAGKTKTVAQYVSVLFMIAVLEVSSWRATLLSGVSVPSEFFSWMLLAGQVFIWFSVVLTVYSGIEYVWGLRHYFTDSK
ncbi:MAG TPA: CDP-diacylglycerol--glycerol-3-phosphate 3-phosphatidyltransferase [Candidatus Avimonas sp.]|nr:CDP-diacylglycerol--glycerol-3-phosphate 3-phosphatidyltransferase [Candidatus Avimonas sp.]HQA15570.1 CDP-diacylglycerol--glycerol-3-phosphate 3-phosphatidyltransferase [Candidatus Avimonas sp.]HQD37600.1 CDP-diacylglycerol--glycerol-3-phosphate 3-phosphatidyltransferase [Candidatus Avimonas sp.]